MNIFQHASRKALFSACLILPFLLNACGGDSSSSADTEYNDEEDEDGLGGEEFKDSTITGNNYKSKTEFSYFSGK